MIFGLKNAKINFYKKSERFECSFYRIQVQVIANLPSRLEETPNTGHYDFFIN